MSLCSSIHIDCFSFSFSYRTEIGQCWKAFHSHNCSRGLSNRRLENALSFFLYLLFVIFLLESQNSYLTFCFHQLFFRGFNLYQIFFSLILVLKRSVIEAFDLFNFQVDFKNGCKVHRFCRSWIICNCICV